ncbi:S-formylglutathione hydrolase [Pseudobacteriovorax antillogorgiicola]|uniref:S-formylglutathione hydrolase n=1 Tax=Pseudobacteriovorax antillogorgiicola TaxID=1513793 RepID=A0A1Y6C979_9BACT|nr:S-formylglutathione hydrolase [Pseudobacteriovorax antillogorgiicola]TCS49055.1 S-formylglutathione hydrolase [Pseudobacteriovorax antillogorgiicola]SMF52464.1 S-formylglutathione hydrolase [Pseudobacteriovorax antillogorgiicola]
MNIETRKSHRCFDGEVLFQSHKSPTTGTDMNLSVFLPKEKPKALMVWLSGLTCTEENFMAKAGAFQFASRQGVAIICPDTSPRGTDLPGEHDDWDFGSGAGFYLDATANPWAQNYKMYSYIVDDISQFIAASNLDHLPRCISGHSMGGHGALTIGLKHPEMFQSISAFAPIVNPMEVPWGQKAFRNYLGDHEESWKAYDACQLVKSSKYNGEILIDQGLADNFLTEQLQPEAFEKACSATAVSLQVRRQKGYDHSYFFVSSFIDDHLSFHLRQLKLT